MNETEQELALDNSDEISVKEVIQKMLYWWHYLLSQWKIILLAGAVFAILGFLYAWSKKAVYKAELSFVLQDEKSNGSFGGAMGLASQLGLDIGGGSAGGEFSGDNFLELMKSRIMIEKTLLSAVNVNGKQETLAEFYIDIYKLREEWKDKPVLKNIRYDLGTDRSKFTLNQNSVLSSIHKSIVGSNLTVEKMKKLSIISLSVKSPNELFSKYFAEILAKVVSDFYIQTKTEKQAKNVAVLQRQTDSVRRMLTQSISGVASSVDINPNPNPLLQTLRVTSQRRQFDVQANTAILQQLVTNLEMSKMSLLQETPLIQAIDRPILPLEKLKPSKSTMAILGAIVGMILSIIYLFFKKKIENLNI